MKPGERLKPIREIKTPMERLAGSPLIDRSEGTLLEVRHLCKSFGMRKNLKWLSRGQEPVVRALSDVSFTIERGECLGLVGESGSGKTTVSKAIMRAVPMDEGEIALPRPRPADRPADSSTCSEMEPIRRKIQYIFQDPYSSLNPRMTVGTILAEPFVIHGIGNDVTRRAAAVRLLEMVGLGAQHLNRYPHSFSGGQRQRIGIARALALQPELVICDEPVSALDVSIQAQILNLLKDLQKEIGLTYLFISHNLAVINYIADRIAVMCAGRLVELAPRAELFRNPLHPYTRALMSAVPYPDPHRPLDFDAIGAARQSNPAAWPEPFRCGSGRRPADAGGLRGPFRARRGAAGARCEARHRGASPDLSGAAIFRAGARVRQPKRPCCYSLSTAAAESEPKAVAAAARGAASRAMDSNIFRYTWRHSKRDQIWLLVVVVVSLPFYFLSLDLPKSIVNGPIQGEGFSSPTDTETAMRIAFDLPTGCSAAARSCSSTASSSAASRRSSISAPSSSSSFSSTATSSSTSRPSRAGSASACCAACASS